jgi:hypothetical protein
MQRLVATATLVVLLSLPAMIASSTVAIAAPAREEEPPDTRTVQLGAVAVHFDSSIAEPIETTSLAALKSSLETVPRITGLAPFSTPIEVFVRDGHDRFREALVEKAGVPIALVAEEVSGYAIERNGIMLLFFTAEGLDREEIATLAFGHELAHLAVREATQRRPVPQWLNEGYAQWTSYELLGEVNEPTAGTFQAIDRAVVSSAIHSDVGLLPWASLVTRSRFSRAGTEGWVELAYGQSTLFVDWLADTYGRASLARFLLRLGEGTTATPAFSQTFGPFAPVEQEFRASIDPLTESLPRGVHRLTGIDARAPLFGVIGGRPGELIHAEIWRDGQLVSTRGYELNPAGFGFVSIPKDVMPGAGDVEVRVRTASLGSLAIRPDQAFAPARPLRAPVQLPIGRWELFDRVVTLRIAV